MTANACVLAQEVVGNRYIELIYRTARDDRRIKVCLFHRSLVTLPIIGHIGGDASIQEPRRDRAGMLVSGVPRGARQGAPASASIGASSSAAASAPGGAGGVWRPKLRDELPEEELRKRFIAISEDERNEFSDFPVIRMPCCFSVHPTGWRQCLYCGALLQYKGNLVPSAPGSMNEMAGEDPIARAAVAAKIVNVGKTASHAQREGRFLATRP